MKEITINGYTFTKLNKDTKLAKDLINKYDKSVKKTLYNCYIKPSQIKKQLYNRCLEICKNLKGKDSKIPGYNENYFSFGFKVENKLIYITAYNKYLIELGEQNERKMD